MQSWYFGVIVLDLWICSVVLLRGLSGVEFLVLCVCVRGLLFGLFCFSCYGLLVVCCETFPGLFLG